jgi:GTP-binding protein
VRIEADFVTSAAGAIGLPGDNVPEVALVGRSNVGKSSLINAVTRQRLARTSAAPGKTRLANVYRVARGNAPPVYLVDLPGYGHAPGGVDAVQGFEELTQAYFGRASAGGRVGPDAADRSASVSALLLVDARHPGLENDRAAWRWMRRAVEASAVVATKVDKLARGQRIRALRELESVFEESVLPFSAVTGEGLDALWNLIDRLANNRNRQPRRSRSLPRATALHHPKK